MNDETALLRAIAAHPDEDTPRLAYADYLDEKGNGPRATFIRGQIELARQKEDSLHRREVAFRCRRLLDAHEEQWLEPRNAFRLDWNWARGFVETFTTSPPELDRQDAALFRTHPFRRLWVWELDGRADGLERVPADNRLTALDLIGNDLSVNQLKKLARMRHFPHLRELGLMFNALRDTAVKVLCGEPFFQRLDLIRLGANPFTDRGRDQLRAHFGNRVSFAHDREPDRLYTLKDDILDVGWGNDLTQLVLLADEEVLRVAEFDHAGNLLRTEERRLHHPAGADYHRRKINRESAANAWLEERGHRSATIRMKRFQFPDGLGLMPFSAWAADAFEIGEPVYPDQRDHVARWLKWGHYRVTFGPDRYLWFDRQGDVTDR
jgi:uncharacterized protein (TIGR02996 family)